ncbi:predicted protein [Naegleria gruberi]|uniref:Predicted protein n=1 Tax=Naegleria gruberi TaxID=5762 RepID=D2V1Z9_NAEGR|nr:uncharacterized protein NAEGRDRAFT_62752 [Naegleria gruberi]EFC49249.1 predicted protein [Naegleria gruberi]|eukprot:XP_002681993.1 predicted protein [Naegleria gruberi strain NEG-M]
MNHPDSCQKFSFEWVMENNECLQVFLQYLQAHQNAEQLECLIEMKELKQDMDLILNSVSNNNSEELCVSNSNTVRQELQRMLGDFPLTDKKKKRRSLFSDSSSNINTTENSVKTIFRKLLEFSTSFLHVNSKRELNLPQTLRNKLSLQIQTFWNLYSKKFGFDEHLPCVNNNSNRNSSNSFQPPVSATSNPPSNSSNTISSPSNNNNRRSVNSNTFNASNVIDIEVTDFYDFITDKSLLNSPKQFTEPPGGLSPVSSLSDTSFSFDGNSILEDFLMCISRVEEVLKELDTFIRLQVKTESFRDFCKSEQLYTFIQKLNPSTEFMRELKRNYRQSMRVRSIANLKDIGDSNEQNLSIMLLNDKLLKWSMNDVLNWIGEHGLEEMEYFITQNKIDGSKLSHLEQYINDSVYPSFEVRKKFEYEVDELLTSFGFEPLPNTDFPDINSRKGKSPPISKNVVDISNETFVLNCQISQSSEIKKIKLKSKQLVNYYSLKKILKDTFGITSDLEIVLVNQSKTCPISPSNILTSFKKDIMNQIKHPNHNSHITEIFEKKLIINI